MRTIPLLVTLALSLAACAPPGPGPTTTIVPAPAPAESLPDISITIPRSIGAFEFVVRQDFDDPSMGSMVRYRDADSLEADVFLYPGPDLGTRCPEQCARRALKAEIDGFSRTMRDRSYLQSFKVLSGADLTPPAGARWIIGHHLHATVRYKARHLRAQHSDYWIVYIPGLRLKVRATFDESPTREAALDRFLTQVVSEFTGSPNGEAAMRPGVRF